jgi:xylulokinase
VISESGELLASATADHRPFRSTQAAWAEQDPSDWWQACQTAIRTILETGTVRASEINCVGLTGQMHGTVVLDAQGQVLRPSIIWCDQRGAAEADQLTKQVGSRRLLEFTCNPALTNFTLIKLLWLREHERQTWNRIQHVLLPKDYVRSCLSGTYAIDVTEASGTLLLDVAHRCWSREMLEQTEIPARWLPALFESPDVCAQVSRSAAQLTGLIEGTPIVAGAGDQAAGAIGMGIARPGTVSSTIGSSGVVFAASAKPVLDPQGRLHTFCHAVPDRWHLMGVTQAAGLSLRWFRDHLTGEENAPWTYDHMASEAAKAPPGSDGLLWGPFLMGERTPHCDPEVRAGLVGIAAHHTRSHVFRAVMEGVAFSLRDTLAIFEDLSVPVEKIRVGGGGARSALWRQIQADVFGQAVETVRVEEGPAFGAALLAGVGANVWSSVDHACDAVVRATERTTGRPDVIELMNDHYQRYQRVYPALKSLVSAVPKFTYV